ncbi:MAG: hypothetical protein WBV73_22925 [Phormidium sp.]
MKSTTWLKSSHGKASTQVNDFGWVLGIVGGVSIAIEPVPI